MALNFYKYTPSSELYGEIAPPTPIKKDEPGLLGNMGRAAGSGALSATGGIFDFVGAEGVAKQFYGWSDSARQSMSQEAQQDMAKPFFDENEQGDIELGEGLADIDTWLLTLANVAGQFAPTAIPGAGLAGAATKAAKLGSTSSKVANAAGMGFTGGAAATGQGMEQARQEYLQMPDEIKAQSELFRNTMKQINTERPGMDADSLWNATDEAIAAKLADDVRKDPATLLANFAGSAIADPIIGKALTGARLAKSGAFRSAAKGFAIEGSTEAGQAGVQEYGINKALSQVDGRDPTAGVLVAALNEGVAGGGFGAAAGAAGGFANRPQAEPVRDPDADAIRGSNPDLAAAFDSTAQSSAQRQADVEVIGNLPAVSRPVLEGELMGTSVPSTFADNQRPAREQRPFTPYAGQIEDKNIIFAADGRSYDDRAMQGEYMGPEGQPAFRPAGLLERAAIDAQSEQRKQAQADMERMRNAPRQIADKNVIFAGDGRPQQAAQEFTQNLQRSAEQSATVPRLPQKDIIFAGDQSGVTVKGNGRPFLSPKEAISSKSARAAKKAGQTIEAVKFGEGWGWRAAKAPASDLAGEQIDKEWTAFADNTGTLKIPRAEMPQIKAEHRGAMVQFMKGRDITHEQDTVQADTLKPTQTEFSPAKVKKAMDYEGGNRSILISSDGYVLDGHHQWLAARENSGSVDVIRLNAPIKQLLPLALEFPSSTTTNGAQDGSNSKGAEARPAIQGRPTGKASIATTPAGRDIDVEYQVVEADSLITSNLEDGRSNPDFPSELQPRDRARAASQDQINRIAGAVNPRLLAESPTTSDGAPIISADGIVESGNGRSLGLKKAYRNGGAKGYRQWLSENGYNVDGMKQPVLVRVRKTELSPEDRLTYIKESNQRTTLEMSVTEQAASDAAKMPGILADYMGGDITSAANRGFVRKFMRDAAGEAERGGMMDTDGILSQNGRRRIEAALLSAAYGDNGIVSQVFESGDTDIKAIGGALLDAAGKWAQMRNAQRDGMIADGMDVTPFMLEAVNLIRKARAEGRPLIELVSTDDIFSGTLPDATRAWLSIFYRGDMLSRARGRDKVAEYLNGYASEALKTQPGDGLFGDAVTSDQVMGALNERVKNQEGGNVQQGGLFTASNAANGEAGAGASREGQGSGTERTDGPDREQANQPAVAAEQTTQAPASAGVSVSESDKAEEIKALGEEVKSALGKYAQRSKLEKRVLALVSEVKASDGNWYMVQQKLLDGNYPADIDQGIAEAVKVLTPKPVNQAASDAAKPSARTEKLKDVGAILLANKKSWFSGMGIKWSDIAGANDTLKLKLTTKSKVWPKPNWESIIASVPDAERDTFAPIVHMVKQVYDAIATAPSGKSDQNLQDYIEAVTKVKDAAENLLSDKQAQGKLWSELGARAERRLSSPYSIGTMATKSDMAPIFAKVFPLVAGGSKFKRGERENDLAVQIGSKAIKAMQFDAGTAVKALQDISKGWPTKQEAWQKQGYAVVELAEKPEAVVGEIKRPTGNVYSARVNFKTTDGGSFREFLGTFDTEQEALKTANDFAGIYNKPVVLISKRKTAISAHDDIDAATEAARAVTRRNTGKEVKDQPLQAADVERVGVERRVGGKDVTAQELMDSFGFTGINFGNWVKADERQWFVNQTYDSFYDLAEILGLPPKAMSLNGMLGVAFGAQGNSGATAHFVPGFNEINLTKNQGAGALAHEWGHALDHYFGVMSGMGKSEAPYASELANLDYRIKNQVRGNLDTDSGIRKVIYDAFVDITSQLKEKPETMEQNRARVKSGHARALSEFDALTEQFESQLSMTGKDALKALRDGNPGDYADIPPPKGKRKSPGAVYGEVMQIANELPEVFSDLRMINALHSKAVSVRLTTEALSDEPALRRIHTDFYAKSRGKDASKGGKVYWSTPVEMFARAFESYVMDRMAERDQRNDFLVRPGKNDAGETNPEYPYPAGTERQNFNAAFNKLIEVIETKETDKGTMLFSKQNTIKAKPAKGINPKAAKQLADSIMKRLNGAAGIKVVVLETQAEAEALWQMSLDGDLVRGAFDAGNNTAYIIAENIRSADELRTTLSHEVIGHGGLKNVISPDQYKAFIDRLTQTRSNKYFAGLWKQIDRDYDGVSEQEKAEELFAYYVQNQPVDGPVKFWWNAMKRWLHKALVSVGLAKAGDPDIEAMQDMLESIRAGFMFSRSGADSGADSELDFRKSQPSAGAFNRWFGGSKVVDENGEPLVVYHGTNADFSVFSDEKLGEATGAASAKMGFFFASNPNVASSYADTDSVYNRGLTGAINRWTNGWYEKFNEKVVGLFGATARTDGGNVMPVYLSIKNPLVVDQAGKEYREQTYYDILVRAKNGGHDGVIIKNTYDEGFMDLGDELTDVYIVFEPTQIKSATGNNGDFDPNNPDIRFSKTGAAQAVTGAITDMVGRKRLDPSDPFAEENRRLREQDKTLWEKAKKVFTRNFAPGGLLPKSVFDSKVIRDSEFEAVEFDVKHLVSAIESAVLKDTGKKIDSQSDEFIETMANTLAGKVDANLGEETKAALVAMRQYIDALSGDYLSVIQGKIDEITERIKLGDKYTDKVQALNEIELYEKIKGNMGVYVNRSYRAFDDPDWFKKVPTEVINKARTYLTGQYKAQGDNQAEAARKAEVTLNKILKTDTAYDSMESFIAEGKLGAKDLSTLIARKDISPEIRELLGEYKDPRINFTKTATKMARLVWNERFLSKIKADGMGVFFFEENNRPAEATVQIAGDQSKTYAPLNGLWTFPDVAQALQDSLGNEQMEAWYEAVVRFNGLVKYGKTVLSPTTAMRNWQSAMFFSVANGHFDFSHMKKSLAAFREQVSQSADGADLAYLRKLKQLGVVYDTPYAGEMMRLLADSKIDEWLQGKKGSVFQSVRQMNRLAQGFYSFGDDFWKIIGFENEKANFIKAGLSEADAEKTAAERIRNTYPTYSMVGKAIKQLTRFPLMGTFVSFPAEIIRTTANMLRYTAEDMKSKNPAIKAMAVKRLWGMGLVSAGFYALSAMTAAMLGVDDDEEEAIRDVGPSWQKNSTFLFYGRDEKGKLQYFDISFLDPYGYWKRPITSLMRDQPWTDGAASGAADMLSPFFGADIAASTFFQVFANKKASGGKVYNEFADAPDQLADITEHIFTGLRPGFVNNAMGILNAATGQRREGSGKEYDLGDEMMALLGWRASSLDAPTSIYYRSFEFGDQLSAANSTLNKVLRSDNAVDDDDIADAKAEAQRQYHDAFKQMQRMVESGRAAGMTREQIHKTLKLSGISSKNISGLIYGKTPPMQAATLQTQANAVAKAREIRGDEQASEVLRRFQIARQLQ